MTRCLKCGSTLAPHARFCSVCGAEFAPPSPAGGGNVTQGFHQTQGGANPNVTQGFSRTSTLSGADLGTTSAFTAQNDAFAADPEAENKKRMMIAGGGVGALLIVAGLIFASASGLLGAKKPNAGGAAVLSAPPAQTVQAPVLNAPAPVIENAPVVSAPGKNAPMPADVVDYLRWLKKFEADRISLESKSEAQMLLVMQALIKDGMVGTKGMGLLDGDSEEASRDPKNAGPRIDTKETNAVIANWNTAAGIFQQKPPPNVCATLASNYNGGLTSSVKAMTEILGGGVRALESINAAGGEKTSDASEVLTFLTDQKNNATMSKNIEGFFAASNQSLDAVRSQYTEIPADIDKAQFSIKSGSAGGLNIPIPGLGM